MLIGMSVQQFGGNSNSLPNGTVPGGMPATMAPVTTISELVIPQSQQKMVGHQQSTMIIPNKGSVPRQQVLGSNGTATSSQILRPAPQIQQHQQTVINNASGILPAGVQVLNMNTVRAAQNVQNMTTLTNPAQRALAPRVVLAPQQMVGSRPGQPLGITLQALQV